MPTVELSQRTRRMRSSAIRDMLRQALQPGMISLAGGNPAPETFPLELMESLTRAVREKHGDRILQYGETEGFPPLQQALARWLSAKGMPCRGEQILVTHGSQNALDLLAKVLLDEGTPIAVESPTYLGALQAMAPFGPRFVPIPSHPEGLDLGVLESAFRQGVRLAYLLPTFQNPSGRELSLANRRGIATLAQTYGALLIEDDPYAELRYEGERLPTLKALAPEQVVYLGSLSKVFAPGLRLGFCLAPEWLRVWLAKAKQGTDLHTCSLSQALAAEFLDSGRLEARLPGNIEAYRRRRDALVQALGSRLPEGFSFERPRGGMFLWLRGPRGFDATTALAGALSRGVAYVPGEHFHVDPHDATHFLRLNFTMSTPEDLEEAVGRLVPCLAP